jgi:hypothetical protein
MRNIHKKIQTLSNIAIIIVALLFGAGLVNRYFLSAPPSKQSVTESKSLKPGTKLSLSGSDWSKSSKTLVLALSTTCRFCTESIPFYQKLAQQRAGHNDVRLIALMPQGVDEAQHYLNEHKISVDEIRQANLTEVISDK